MGRELNGVARIVGVFPVSMKAFSSNQRIEEFEREREKAERRIEHVDCILLFLLCSLHARLQI